VRVIRFRIMTLPAMLLLLAATAPALAEDPPKKEGQATGTASGEVKEAGRELVKDTKEAGRDLKNSKAGRYVEEAARELGSDVAGASKQGWDKTKSFSSSAAEEVKQATREFWNDVIRTKEAMAGKLRKENAELKSKKEGEPPRSEPAKEAK
jgi:hypothetical protein